MLLKKIIEFCVNRSVTIFILGLTILFSGLYGLKTARLDVFPDFAQPQVVIQTEAPGFTSELTELLVSKPIENSLVGVVGVESIRSQSSPGLSVITIIFKESQDILLSRQLISEKLISTISQLPKNVEIPEITPLTSSASSVLGIGITSTERSLIEQRELVEQIIIPRLIETQGVADISIFGGESRQRQIRIIPESLFKTEISLEEILDKIEKSLGVKPSGYFENNNQRFEILTDSQPKKIKDLESFVIGEVESRPVKILDVATVKDSKGPVSSTANINGQPGIFLMVQAQPKSDTLKLTNALEKKIKELEPTLILEGLILHNGLFRPANFIEEAFSNVQKDILIGATLVLAVLFLFLLNLKTALISAIAIPLSLLSSILILVYQGVALNIMVLGGLVIALGEVVDDAIIDTENIFRRLKENKLKKNPENPLKVVINASMEIRHSVISATVIVILAFSPLLFIPGVAGRLFEPLGLAYIYALTSSLIIALTVTPALCTLLLLKNSSFKTEESPTVLFLKRNYVILLNKIEKAPKEVAATTIFFLLIGLSTLPLFKVEFIPELREGHYIVHMTAVPGTSAVEMNRVGKLVTKKIRNIKNVKSTAQWVGRAENGADTFGMNYSEIQVEVGPLTGSEQEETVNEIKLALTQVDSENKSQPFPGFTFGIHTFLSERIEETVSGYTADFVIEIVGLDLEKIQNDAKKITQIMQKIEGAENVKMVAPSSTPQIKVDILWDKLSAFGLQADEVIRTISTVFHGIQVGEINNNERTIPIIVTTNKKIKKNIENLKEVPFISKEGIKFRLKDISNIYFDTGRSKILRDGGKRIQAITTDINKRDLFEFKKEVENEINSSIELSKGNYVIYSGNTTEYDKTYKSLFTNGILALIGVIIILRFSLNNNINLIIVLLNLPFCLIGGVFAIILSGGWLSIGSIVGFVTLFGITIRNSIMLVSHYQHLVFVNGLPWNFETALKGSSERLPSILMTAIVTALGLLPLVIGSGEPGREIEGPMASIIVGGLISSTILNLFILPTMLVNYGNFEKNSKLITI